MSPASEPVGDLERPDVRSDPSESGRPEVTVDDPGPPGLIGTRLREARTYVGLAEEDVAAALGVPVASISALESGQRQPTGTEVQRLAGIYRRPSGWLLGEDTVALNDPDGLFQAAKRLSAGDRDQVLRFAEFLAGAGPPAKSRPRGRSGRPEPVTGR
ncbi:MAG TPA: helix-turn-helix transcriptional regulator [Acidimicrobiales bacterium]|jgi:transcriptional regulator with XRE-family HTH domain|nr:helix-turn-helix transcriptional regulator [Acidimicrobiales bacterium]